LSNPALINDDSKCIFIKTKIKKQIEFKNIQIEPKNKYLIMQATAYDLSTQCCGKSYTNPSRGITRSGYNLTNKSHRDSWTVASNRFSIGTKLKLEFPESHKRYNGIYTVRDTGSFDRNVLDVYIGDYGEKVHQDTINFGRVDVKVEVIKIEK
jgi:3D (Asp-Asp-Asp) domain-containing protein